MKAQTFMPTIRRSGPYRFYFYSHEPNEPPHVHVDRDARSAKFWLNPTSLAKNLGFKPKELAKLGRVVMTHRNEFMRAWYGYFKA